MDHHTENTSTFIAKPAHSLVWKQRPAICRSPAPQTSLSTSFQSLVGLFQSNSNIPYSIFTVFQLPDELILFILSYIFPEPRLAGSYARYCVQYCMEINSDHQRRMESSLQPLSMACRTMRLRLLPWIWDLIQPSRRFGIYLVLWNFNATTRAVHVNRSLATFVRYFRTLLRTWSGADVCPLKVHDGTLPEGRGGSPVCPVLIVPTKSPHSQARVIR